MKSFKDISIGGFHALIDYTTKDVLKMLKSDEDEPQMYFPLSNMAEEIFSVAKEYIDIKNLVEPPENEFWNNIKCACINKLKASGGKIIVFDGLSKLMDELYVDTTPYRFEDKLKDYDFLREPERLARENNICVFITIGSDYWVEYMRPYQELFQTINHKS